MPQPPAAIAPEGARPQSIDEVIATMTAIGQQLDPEPGPGFGTYCFNHLYLSVTEGIRDSLHRGDFVDAAAVEQLDVMFAQVYFDALQAANGGGDVPDAWRVLFNAADHTGILPIQFAVAGMNAHINHDLPLALLEQWEGDATRPGRDGPAWTDFEKINDVLAAETAKLKGGLEPGCVRDFEAIDPALLGRLDNRLAMFIVADVRAQAWATADHLWDVRHIAPAREIALVAIDRLVAVWGRAFLLPL